MPPAILIRADGMCTLILEEVTLEFLLPIYYGNKSIVRTVTAQSNRGEQEVGLVSSVMSF